MIFFQYEVSRSRNISDEPPNNEMAQTCGQQHIETPCPSTSLPIHFKIIPKLWPKGTKDEEDNGPAQQWAIDPSTPLSKL